MEAGIALANDKRAASLKWRDALAKQAAGKRAKYAAEIFQRPGLQLAQKTSALLKNQAGMAAVTNPSSTVRTLANEVAHGPIQADIWKESIAQFHYVDERAGLEALLVFISD